MMWPVSDRATSGHGQRPARANYLSILLTIIILRLENQTCLNIFFVIAANSFAVQTGKMLTLMLMEEKK
jgi:hypothetical protein